MHCKMLLKYLPIQVMLLGSAEGLFYFTAWKCINLNFSHQNHYKLHVKVRIYSQTCSTNSTGCVQSCTEVYKLNMTWVMLDMDNCSIPKCLAGHLCAELCAWAHGRDWGRGLGSSDMAAKTQHLKMGLCQLGSSSMTNSDPALFVFLMV